MTWLARIMHVISHFFVVLYEVSTSGRALASPAAAAGLDDFGGLRLTTGGGETGTLPWGSGKQAEARQALDAEAQDRLIRAGSGPGGADTLLEFIDTGSNLDKEAVVIELGGAQGGPLGQGLLECPHQPVRRCVQEQAE